MKRTGKSFFLFFLIISELLLSSGILRAQAAPSKNNTHKLLLSGNQQFASVSADGKIVFQSDENGVDNIYLFNPAVDSTFQITLDTVDEQHPVWVPHKIAIVFDAGKGKNARLFYLDLKTRKKRRLLYRHIACREASFTPSRHLVVFSGFDDRTQHWQIFTYDFIYDNLNRLSTEKGDCRFPVFSPDGKNIVFTVREDNGISRLKIMNWYGDKQKVLAANTSGRVCWTRDSWRILFVVKNGNSYSLNSILADGSGEKEILSVSYPVCCPVLSNNGKQLMLSEKKSDKFQIVITPEKEE